MPGEDAFPYELSSGDIGWVVDTYGRIVYWNEEAARAFGLAAHEVIGCPCQDVIRGCSVEQRAFCPCDATETFPGTRSFTPQASVLRARCGDGVVRSLELSRFLFRERKMPQQAFVLHIARLQPSTHPSGLQIHLLGPVSVRRRDGKQAQGPGWRRAKVRALLGILALRTGQPIHRESLLELLWSDLDYESALHNLNTTVYDLRCSLKDLDKQGTSLVPVLYESNHYSLHWSGDDWLDTTTFEDEIRLAREAQAHDAAARHYETALDLYRGDLLDDVILVFHNQALLREQARLRDLYLTAMAEIGALFQQMSQEKKAVDIYRRLLALDPCREKACRKLMKLSLRQGDRTTALTHYKQLQEALSSEIGVQPEEETRRIYEKACTT